MKKISKSALGLVGVVSVAWWLGGMMYFLLVTKHFRDKELYEDANKNIASYLGGVGRRNDRDATIPKFGKPTTAPRPIRDSNNYISSKRT